MEHFSYDDHSRVKVPIPQGLYDTIAASDTIALMHETDLGTAFFVKVPSYEIVSARGPLPMIMQHSLHRTDYAPVIGTSLILYDQPGDPLIFDTYTNIADPEHVSYYRRLAGQNFFNMFFFDEMMNQALVKYFTHTSGEQMEQILIHAERVRQSIPATRYDFDEAKRVVQATRRLR